MSLLDRAKACPWCAQRDVWVWDKAVPGRFAICCSNGRCASTGPIRDSVDEAVIAWNAAPRAKPSLLERAILDELYDEARLDREIDRH